jgi:hypothetical protein
MVSARAEAICIQGIQPARLLVGRGGELRRTADDISAAAHVACP